MNTKDFQTQLQRGIQQMLAFRVPLFVVLLLSVYIFIALRIDSLRNAEPNASAVASQTAAAPPHIDQATVDKIKQLQDNSVSVRALFNQARENPFKE